MNASFFRVAGTLATGTLQRNSSFQSTSRWAKQLPASLPVLCATLDAQGFQGMLKQGGRSSIGFGSIPFTTSEGATRHVMTIRRQVENTQCYWLADMADAEVWSAIDAWRKHKLIPTAISCGQQLMYSAVEYPFTRSTLDQLRGEICPDASQQYWDVAVGLASNGLVRAQATTDVQGVALKNVAVNVLVTKRLRHFADTEMVAAERLRKKPIADLLGSTFPDIARW